MYTLLSLKVMLYILSCRGKGYLKPRSLAAADEVCTIHKYTATKHISTMHGTRAFDVFVTLHQIAVWK
jgi:hypothetical protein